MDESLRAALAAREKFLIRIEEGLAARIAQNLDERRFCRFQLSLLERCDLMLLTS
ncbi:MAG: hypothetical protein WAN81_21220 [Candidatus Binataceae bacterium]